MDIGKSLSFVFEDKRWLEKVLIGGLITLGAILFSWTIIGAIVGAALLYGYMIELVRNVRRAEATPLPEWDKWGEKIILGIKYGILLFIWWLPALVVALPLGLLSAVFSDTNTNDFVGLLWTCFSCLYFLYGILILVATPAITFYFAERGDITDGLKFNEILGFTRRNLGDVIIVVIVIVAVGFVAGIVGFVLCGIGLLFTTFWATLVQGHLYGQIGRKDAGALVPSGGPGIDLSPNSIMPGVGEITQEVQAGAQQAVTTMADLGESVAETTKDVVDQPPAS